MAFNSLSGAIPSEIQNLKRLGALLLNKNRFTGSLVLGRNQGVLRYVDISNNRITGSLPTSLFTMNDLLTFAAVDNCMIGIMFIMFVYYLL